MNNIQNIDRNFAVAESVNSGDTVFYNVLQAPFRLYGVFFENGKFWRMDESVAKEVSDGVHALCANTAGGRVRFRTNSRTFTVKARLSAVSRVSHATLVSMAGFDLYVTENGKMEYAKTFVPPYDFQDSYESCVEFKTAEEREVTIHFPLYSNVLDLQIGLDRDATLAEASPYEIEKPIVYYGSSITQGGCASRPGNAYQAILSRRLSTDYINLGFSGNAKGEVAMAEYIKKLEMSVFVMDYDHNAPTPAYLEETHETFFRIIRDANPDLPIVLMSRPEHILPPGSIKRRATVEKTYLNARAEGDENVYFLDGPALTKLCGREGTVDGTHPNDFGFYSMAHALEEVLRKILK